MKHILLLLIIFCWNISYPQIKHEDDNNQQILIPVSFHIVQNNSNRTEFDVNEGHKKIYKRLAVLLKRINEGFNNVSKDSIEIEYHNDIAKCNILFDLASDNKGVTFHETKIKKFNKKHDNSVLKKNGYINSLKFLNIWICDLEDIITPYGNALHGYSTFPNEKNEKLDGVVISFEVLGANDLNAMASITTHEIGHWLGLKHIWGNNNTGILDCWTDDDVVDTPKQKKPHKYKTTPYSINDIQDVCFPSQTKHIKTNYQNFMDYSHVYGMFTKGQALKMRSNIFNFRKGFINNNSEYLKMSKSAFYYYVLSANNLDYKNNDIFIEHFLTRIKKTKSTSEFDLKKIKQELKEEIEHEISVLGNKYKKSNYVDFIRDYNFENQTFPFSLPDNLWDNSYLLDYFKEIKKFNDFRIYAINNKDFNSITLSELEAEKFIELSNNRYIYPQIEYTTLKLPIKDSKGKISGMLAFIDRVKIYSDSQRTNLIYTLNAKSIKKDYEKYNYAKRSSNTQTTEYEFH